MERIIEQPAHTQSVATQKSDYALRRMMVAMVRGQYAFGASDRLQQNILERSKVNGLLRQALS